GLGVGVVALLVTELPDPRVGLAPAAGNVIGVLRRLLAGIPVEAADVVRVDEDRIEHVSVDVELFLAGGVVSDADGPRVTIAVEGELAFCQVRVAVDAIDRSEVRLLQARSVHQPPEERLRLAVVAELEQRLEREARVAGPRE